MQKLKRQQLPATPRRGRAAKRPRVLAGDKQRRIPIGDITLPAQSARATGVASAAPAPKSAPFGTKSASIWRQQVSIYDIAFCHLNVTQTAMYPAFTIAPACSGFPAGRSMVGGLNDGDEQQEPWLGNDALPSFSPLTLRRSRRDDTEFQVAKVLLPSPKHRHVLKWRCH